MKVIKLADGLDLSNENLDPHVWVAPGLVKNQLPALTEAISAEMLEQRDFFLKNMNDFVSDIDSLAEKIKNQLANVKTKKFLVLHPAWGYFAKEFGLEQIAIEQHGQIGQVTIVLYAALPLI